MDQEFESFHSLGDIQIFQPEKRNRTDEYN
jgi:hypothetical protein